MSEADVHFELYRHVQNAIDDQPSRGQITFGSARPEYSEGISGRADIVIFDDSHNPILVVEAKKPGDSGNRDIDPYSPDVIEQGLEYATKLGAPFTATYNGSRLVLFKTLEPGKPFLQRATKSYEISSVPKFADELLNEVSRFEAKQAQWDSLDNAFIKRVKSLHEFVSPRIEDSLQEKIEEDSSFQVSFEEWADKQGLEYSDASKSEKEDILQNFSEQATYLLINKILFYKILENSPAYGDEVAPLAVSIHRVQEDLEEHFDKIVSDVDFEAIFEHDDIYSEIPLEPVAEKIREFVIELDDQDLTQFDSDVIGRIYEGVIPHERRHEMGEYYTPAAVCDLITRLCIDSSSDTVLDPACGSGGFLVSAYNRLQELFPEAKGAHTEILNRIYGVDINRFPAHLSAINLAIQDLESYTEDVHIEVSDYFDVASDTQRFGRVVAGLSGREWQNGDSEDALGGFDAVVGNPPYIRATSLDDKSRIRSHLSDLDATDLSSQMDIYGYFITHSTQFLSDGGKLGFITSDRWMDTDYGADLQKFLLDNYSIDAVIRFDRQTFDDALVGASIIIATKEPDTPTRDENTVKFLRVREPLEIDEIESILREDTASDQMINDTEYRLVTRRQGDLYDQDKWKPYFLASPVYFDLYGHDDTTELQDVADVSRGITSGANPFYYGRREEWEDLGLTEYTEPLLKATGQLDSIRFNDEDAKEWGVLSIHDLVEQGIEESKAQEEESEEYRDIDPAERAKSWMADNGHETLVEYIEWGEDKGYDDRPTTSSRSVWYDLGELDTPKILTTDFTWRIFRSVWNEAGAAVNDQFYCIEPRNDIDDQVLCGILNSRFAWLMVELRGRWAGGQGMTRARIKVYETEELPIPDPRTMSDEEKERIRGAFEDLMDKEDELDEEDRNVENTEDERTELDRAVLAALGMEDRVDDLRAAVEEQVALREQDAGERTQVLVNRPQETEVINLEGVTETRDSTTLSDFN
ncbi:N-6 DNA methylase [Halopiger aswanensis]|uniref:N-6 DNA methylase n=1 Tax=Halopiger aswanensis TaxID=148449 RepID=A0A3R7HKJ2_9EURY|nr:N-6 DNA methylase [Halopiger aswanensis]RKD97829.1 N-6 DNA methylase [Halopiger aswanensis]